MLTALDWLVLVFVGMTGISLLAICLMYLLKNETIKKIAFYFLGIQGMLISWMNAMSTPDSFPLELALGWGLGGLSIAALLLQICGKHPKKSQIARILVTVSVVIGMWNTFIY